MAGTRTVVVKKLFSVLKQNQRNMQEEKNYISALTENLEWSRVTISKAVRHLVEMGVVVPDLREGRKILLVHDCLID